MLKIIANQLKMFSNGSDSVNMNTPGEANKVLLIDDEKDIIYFFSGIFKHMAGIKFLTASGARQGIELAKAEKPIVVMMDLRMPGMNGEEALRELKPLLPKTKFIVMTGWDDGQTKDRVINEIGVEAYFDKPVNLEEVITKVVSLITLK